MAQLDPKQMSFKDEVAAVRARLGISEIRAKDIRVRDIICSQENKELLKVQMIAPARSPGYIIFQGQPRSPGVQGQTSFHKDTLLLVKERD